MFNRILVPLDGSEHSIRALEAAIEIAKKFDSNIILIHVYSVSSFALTPKQVLKFVEAVQELANTILEDGKQRVQKEGILVETIMKEGHTIHEILETAKIKNINLIVMGSRGVSKLKEIFLGSVSEGVLRQSPIPIMVTK